MESLGRRKRIGLVAHDNKKRDLIEWARYNRLLLEAHDLVATGTTGTLLEDALGVGVEKLQSGPLGGDQQLGALIAEGDVELLRQAWLTATRARNALVLVRGKPTDQLPGPGRQLNAVALAAGWDSDDGGEFLDNYLRVTRRAKAVVRKVFGE